MADDDRPQVGSVAEEAARLLDALGGWAGTARGGYAAEPAERHTSPAPEPDGAAADGAAGPDEATADVPAACGSCGAEQAQDQPATCRLCPLCQAIGVLRSVRPETVDRLADLAGALAATLRDVADQRRGPAPGGAGSRTTSPSRVQDIEVEDDDAAGDLHDDAAGDVPARGQGR